jgi:hypothetical protein
MSEIPSTWIGSPNFTPGRGGIRPTFIVMHHSECDVLRENAIFENDDPNQLGGPRSAHWSINRDGSAEHYVHESDAAWHAGVFDANLRSIGQEHEETGDDSFTDPQYETAATNLADMSQRWGIPISSETVVGHDQVPDPQSPTGHYRTACPGRLDIGRIIGRAQEILRERSTPSQPDEPLPSPAIPAVQASAPLTGQVNGSVDVHSFPRTVHVLVPLRVRTGPHLTSPSVTQPTPNGVLNPPYSFDAVGIVRGDSYTIGTTSDLWIRTKLGHYVAALGTDYSPNTPNAQTS